MTIHDEARKWASAGDPEPAEGQDGRLTLTFPGGARVLAAYASACRILGIGADEAIGQAMARVIDAATAVIERGDVRRPALVIAPEPTNGRRNRTTTRARMVRGRSGS